ncbi:hypothetical protein P5V15_008574 [Pogonomyrmex californicus]
MSTEGFSGKVFLLITGASRGIGRQIAITFGSLLEEGSHMLLLARDKNALEEVAKIIPPKIKICIINADLSKATKTDFEMIMNIFDDKIIKKTIINITSLFGIQAIKGFAYYCTVKAAREMYFKVFALENPNVNVLSYSPGPVDTNMFNFLCEFAVDPETKKRFLDKKQKIMLTPEQTINRLVHILEKHKYKSGDRISYYDNM